MIHRLLRAGCLALTGWGVLQAFVPTAAPDHPAGAAAASVQGSTVVDKLPSVELRGLVALAPFRPNRRPAVRPQPRPGAIELASRPPARVVPPVVLTGLVWGPEPVAVLEGLPGSAGPEVVHVEESFGDITVRAIGPDRVQLSTRDTSWSLTVREPWQ